MFTLYKLLYKFKIISHQQYFEFLVKKHYELKEKYGL
jgi:hypothetical protein